MKKCPQDLGERFKPVKLKKGKIIEVTWTIPAEPNSKRKIKRKVTYKKKELKELNDAVPCEYKEAENDGRRK